MPIDKHGRITNALDDSRVRFPIHYLRPNGGVNLAPSNDQKNDQKLASANVLEFAYHHVIPYHVIRDMWNYLLEQEAWPAIRSFLHLIGQPNPVQIFEHLMAGSLTEAEGKELEENLVWPPWNLVMGPAPRLRYDDPGEGFENFTVDAMGFNAAPNEAPYLTHTEALGSSITRFMDQLTRLRTAEADEAARIAIEEQRREKYLASPKSSALPPSTRAPSGHSEEKKSANPRERKSANPDLVPDMQGALRDLQVAFQRHAKVLHQVTVPVLYLEKMWVKQGRFYAIHGSSASVSRNPTPPPPPPNTPPPPRITSSMFIRSEAPCIKCTRHYSVPNPNAKKPPTSDDMKRWPLCGTCAIPRQFAAK